MAAAIHPAETSPTAHMASAVTLPLPKGVLPDVTTLPGILLDWLVDLALLKPLPLSAIVPDAAWLPPESLRFFHVDWRWTERLIDGALSAGNLGLQDQLLHRRVVADLRGQMVAQLRSLAGQPLAEGEIPRAAFPMTGMLMRSAIVRSWPRMAVRAYSDIDGTEKLMLMRRELLSQNILLVLFPGAPKRVEIQEPYEGVQFGVEPENDKFMLTLREENGTVAPNDLQTEVTMGEAGVIRLKDTHQNLIYKLCKAHNNALYPVASQGPAILGLNLQQLPYVQIFRGGEHV